MLTIYQVKNYGYTVQLNSFTDCKARNPKLKDALFDLRNKADYWISTLIENNIDPYDDLFDVVELDEETLDNIALSVTKLFEREQSIPYDINYHKIVFGNDTIEIPQNVDQNFQERWPVDTDRGGN